MLFPRAARRLVGLTAVILVAAAGAGCAVFDPALFRNRDAGGDVNNDVRVAFPVAETCMGTVPAVASSATNFLVDTTPLRDDFTNTSGCTGTTTPGNDGFFALSVQAGQRWHVHVRSMATTEDPAVYFVSSCNEAACMRGEGLDECRDNNEHISFMSETTGTYFVGIDSRRAGGTTYEVLAQQAICGNGVREHPETCDTMDPVTMAHCNTRCQVELSGGNGLEEVNPNDDASNANVVLLPAGGTPITVTGGLGGACDFDMYEIQVPDNQRVTAAVLSPDGSACPTATTPVRLSLVNLLGNTFRQNELGAVEGSAAAPCPALGAGQAFTLRPSGGRYFLRVTALNPAVPTFRYGLQIQVGP